MLLVKESKHARHTQRQIQSNKMWRLCLRVMLIGVICVCALPENPSLLKSVRKRDTTQRYCGKNLVDILRLLCRSQYNGIEEERKRSEETTQRKVARDLEYVLWSRPKAVEEPEVRFPFRSRSAANTFRRQKRNDGGIVDECCIYKGCTVNELTDYCSSRR